MEAGDVVGALARGAVAGVAGTVAMTASQAVEMRLTGRQPSDVPAQVGERLSGYTPADEAAHQRVNTGVHWGHGVVNGALRGLIGLTGATGASATALHFGAVWGTDAALYHALGIAPPPWAWETAALGTDVLHKGVYAVVTGLVYERLDR